MEMKEDIDTWKVKKRETEVTICMAKSCAVSGDGRMDVAGDCNHVE